MNLRIQYSSTLEKAGPSLVCHSVWLAGAGSIYQEGLTNLLLFGDLSKLVNCSHDGLRETHMLNWDRRCSPVSSILNPGYWTWLNKNQLFSKPGSNYSGLWEEIVIVSLGLLWLQQQHWVASKVGKCQFVICQHSCFCPIKGAQRLGICWCQFWRYSPQGDDAHDPTF